VQTGYGAHPASYLIGNEGSFQEVKQPGREADQSPIASAEVKKTCIYTSTPPYAFMASQAEGQLCLYLCLGAGTEQSI
jgi:hypothetical protein